MFNRRNLAALAFCGFACCTGALQSPSHDAGELAAVDAAHVSAVTDAGALGASDAALFDAQSSAAAGAGSDGGAPADASPADGGSQDADAPRQGPTSCAGKAYLLCEDFEQTAEGALPSGFELLSAWGGGEVPRVVSGEHHSGARALRTGVAPNGQTRAVHDLSALGAAAGKHWGRVFFKAHAPIALPSQGAVIHNTLVALRGKDESRVVDTVIASDGSHQFLYNVPDDSVGIGTDYRYHAYDGAWHCAEWYVDQSTQAYRFFFDGEEAQLMNAAGQTPRLEVFSSIALGFINYQTPSTPYAGWLDDLALHTGRIGCDITVQ